MSTPRRHSRADRTTVEERPFKGRVKARGIAAALAAEADGFPLAEKYPIGYNEALEYLAPVVRF